MKRVSYFILLLVFFISSNVIADKLEIKMDLSYDYSKDPFLYIYTNDNGVEYDVTNRVTSKITNIEVGLTNGRKAIVRKVEATFSSRKDTIYEYTAFYNNSTNFQNIYEDMQTINRNLIEKYNKTLDILNIKIEKNTYKGEGGTNFKLSTTKSPKHIGREVNFIGCNSNSSNYDKPIFDGENKKNQFLLVGNNDISTGNPGIRRVNYYNFEVHNYENGIFHQYHDNGTFKGLRFKNINNNTVTDKRAEAAISINHSSSNNVITDSIFNAINGGTINVSDDTYLHAIYFNHGSNNNKVYNNYFSSSTSNTIKFSYGSNNNKIEKNYFFKVGNYRSPTSESYAGFKYGFVADNRTKDATDNELGIGNEFCANVIRQPYKEYLTNVISLTPKGNPSTLTYKFTKETCSPSGSKCTISGYQYDKNIKVNSCSVGNSQEVSSTAFTMSWVVVKHVDESGNKLRANDVYLVNSGEAYRITPALGLIGMDNTNSRPRLYDVKLYDSNNNEITSYINSKGERVSVEKYTTGSSKGYIKANNPKYDMKSGSSNIVYKFIYKKLGDTATTTSSTNSTTKPFTTTNNNNSSSEEIVSESEGYSAIESYNSSFSNVPTDPYVEKKEESIIIHSGSNTNNNSSDKKSSKQNKITNTITIEETDVGKDIEIVADKGRRINKIIVDGREVKVNKKSNKYTISKDEVKEGSVVEVIYEDVRPPLEVLMNDPIPRTGMLIAIVIVSLIIVINIIHKIKDAIIGLQTKK